MLRPTWLQKPYFAAWLALGILGCADPKSKLAREPKLAPESAASAQVPAPGVVLPREAARPRLYAKTRLVWIQPTPDSTTEWIGYLQPGSSVELRGGRPEFGPGCSGGWYAVQPRGYVCVNGKQATLDPNDPIYSAIRQHLGDYETAFPHHYGRSLGVARVPFLDPAPLSLPRLPFGVHENYTKLGPSSTIAYVAEARQDGQDWLLSADFMWVPKEQVEPLPEVQFQGVRLEGSTRLPLAFFRESDRPQYRRDSRHGFILTEQVFPRLSSVKLSGEVVLVRNDTFWQTDQPAIYVRQADAVIPRAAPAAPWGNDPSLAEHSWIEVHIKAGWLLAYIGKRPVYATLITPGTGGAGAPSSTLTKKSVTPVGKFAINGKFLTATMEPAPGVFHSEVPWTQNFSGPHSIHSAYWHNAWGEAKSSGCINVSPRDGRFLFDFTEPKLPAGWHAVRWLPKHGSATWVVVKP